MARPIDADALDKMLADAQTECKRNGGNFRVGVLSNVRENIANFPAIDAIPVEWIQKFCEDDISEDQRETIEWMLKVWKRE